MCHQEGCVFPVRIAEAPIMRMKKVLAHNGLMCLCDKLLVHILVSWSPYILSHGTQVETCKSVTVSIVRKKRSHLGRFIG